MRPGGDLEINVARQDVRQVLAIDVATDQLKLARARLGDEGAKPPPEIRPSSGSLAGLGDQRFDVVLAADAVRHCGAESSSRHLEALSIELSVHLEDGGLLAVGVLAAV